MKYNSIDIGNRIRQERKNAGYSQDGMIAVLKDTYGISVARNKISDIENGKTNHYDSDLLFALCDLFDCEYGYLLCEYACRTGRDTDICRETGLTENAVQTLRRLRCDNAIQQYSDIVSAVLETKSLDDTLEVIAMAISAQNQSLHDAVPTPVAQLNWGNMHMAVRNDALISSMITARALTTTNEAAQIYMRNVSATPMDRRYEYANEDHEPSDLYQIYE